MRRRTPLVSKEAAIFFPRELITFLRERITFSRELLTSRLSSPLASRKNGKRKITVTQGTARQNRSATPMISVDPKGKRMMEKKKGNQSHEASVNSFLLATAL